MTQVEQYHQLNLHEPVLTCECAEPSGLYNRAVYPMHFTLDNLRLFWDKTREFKHIFDQTVNGDFKTFCELFLSNAPGGGVQPNGLFWIVDNFVGMFYMTKIVPNVDAEVHYVFFDRRHIGREKLAREMILYVFRKYNFQRLSVELPMYASKNAFLFVKSLGFRAEGRKRAAVWHNDAWFDVMMYGMLKDDALGNLPQR